MSWAINSLTTIIISSLSNFVWGISKIAIMLACKVAIKLWLVKKISKLSYRKKCIPGTALPFIKLNLSSRNWFPGHGWEELENNFENWISNKGAFINDVKQIWPKIDPPSPSVTLKWLFHWQLSTACHIIQYPPLPYLRDVIYEWSLTKVVGKTSSMF